MQIALTAAGQGHHAEGACTMLAKIAKQLGQDHNTFKLTANLLVTGT